MARSANIHLRMVFENCKHGADMQTSTVIQNLHEKVLAEGRVPEEFFVGADSTPKETKNNVFCWWLIWLLCVLQDTCLWSTGMLCLIVGHTHDKIDRLRSMLKIALRGHDFNTVDDVMKILTKGLPRFSFDWSHLSRVWDWSSMKTLDLPPFCGFVEDARGQFLQVQWDLCQMETLPHVGGVEPSGADRPSA